MHWRQVFVELLVIISCGGEKNNYLPTYLLANFRVQQYLWHGTVYGCAELYMCFNHLLCGFFLLYSGT